MLSPVHQEHPTAADRQRQAELAHFEALGATPDQVKRAGELSDADRAEVLRWYTRHVAGQPTA